MTETEVPCCVEGCPTRVQRSLNGTIADGLQQHLQIVHPLEAEELEQGR